MNTSIMIKGADFSKNNVGKLKLQKLEVIKAGDGYLRYDDNTLKTITTSSSTGWNPGEEVAHSEIIQLPNNTRYLFGTYTQITNNTGLNKFNNLDFNDGSRYYALNCSTFSTFLYYRESTESFYNVFDIYFRKYNIPEIISLKSGLYSNSIFNVMKIRGPMYGLRFQYDDITKIAVNWVKHDSKYASDIGMVVPEIYACIEE